MKPRPARPLSASSAAGPSPAAAAELHRAVTTRRAPSAPPVSVAQRMQAQTGDCRSNSQPQQGAQRTSSRPLEASAVLRGTGTGPSRAASSPTSPEQPPGQPTWPRGDDPRDAARSQTAPAVEDDKLCREQKGSVLHIRRPSEVRIANPERFNLDRKRLTACPILEGEERLKLLNFQNNFITQISNLHGLPNLVFLDLYNNSITSITGLECVPTLRVLMLGRNCIEKVDGLGALSRLDVLDLHNNNIEQMENLEHLSELRVLNLAGNRLREISQVRGLRALTEVNLRRNKIEHLRGFEALHNLQRVFLSSNDLKSLQDCATLWGCRSLSELSLDANPLAHDTAYRQTVIDRARALRSLDTKRVTDEERRVAAAFARREEERQQERARREAALTERHDALAYIQRTWDADAGTLSGVVSPSSSGSSDADNAKRPSVRGGPGGGSKDEGKDKRKGFMEVDATGVVSVYGSGAEWSPPERADLSAVRAVSFECVLFGRVVSHFLPRLAALPSLRLLRLAHNGISSFSQMAQLRQLTQVEEIEMANNAVLGSLPLLRRFMCVALPSLRRLNGQDLTAAERAHAASEFSGISRVLQCTPTALALARRQQGGGRLRQSIDSGPQSSPYVVRDALVGAEGDGPSTSTVRVASGYVESVVGHATAIDAKIQLLNRQWDSIVQRLIVSVLTKAQEEHRGTSDSYYDLE
eukprot:TRINITY_DN4496_c0_g1_i1.p1 TRINITY_DN4496_c0_g1~~TRINITY_DN4496_c0_g1_i1.p1  ORF type:complete len:699 (+),score=173.94 TRINITY_DN4496_c0_g1_i1:68-2164(+)